MQTDENSDNVQDQNLLNDEITQQLASLQGGVTTVQPVGDTGVSSGGYQRQGLDSPVDQPGAVVSPAPYEPPTEIEASEAIASDTQTVQNMVSPEETTEPTVSSSVVPETAEEIQADTEQELNADNDAQVINQAVAPLTADETEEAEQDEEEVPELEESIEPEEESVPTELAVSGELEEVKKRALEELAPLVDKIDLEPAKRYDILMEMIQATNDEELVPKAYEAAHAIEDENLRAQALLEIVNEVDFLTKPEDK